MNRPMLFRLAAALPLAALAACGPRPAPAPSPSPAPPPSAAADARPAPQIISEKPELGPVRPYRVPPVEELRLANGLRVVLVRQTTMPLVTARLIVEAGAEYEPAEKNGLAVLTASLLPEGTQTMTGPELAERMERLGAQFQTGAGQNAAFVVVTGLKSVFGEALGLAASTVLAPGFAEREFERVRGQAIAGHVQAQSTVEGLATEAFNRALFAAEAPYARPPGGTAPTLRGITRDDVLGWHRQMYAPANSTLLLVGDLTAAEARTLAERAFGAWSGAGASRARPANAARPVARTRVILVDRPGSVQSTLRIGHRAPERATPDYV
ncbi:MAG TPA: pitrilysin family protein, partial [Longimicrobium sp.]|nr:pitrilysin family protein [Longimicrobium sp.]